MPTMDFVESCKQQWLDIQRQKSEDWLDLEKDEAHANVSDYFERSVQRYPYPSIAI
jgi:hypothetical protein